MLISRVAALDELVTFLVSLSISEVVELIDFSYWRVHTILSVLMIKIIDRASRLISLLVYMIAM